MTTAHPRNQEFLLLPAYEKMLLNGQQKNHNNIISKQCTKQMDLCTKLGLPCMYVMQNIAQYAKMWLHVWKFNHIGRIGAILLSWTNMPHKLSRCNGMLRWAIGECKMEVDAKQLSM